MKVPGTFPLVDLSPARTFRVQFGVLSPARLKHVRLRRVSGRVWIVGLTLVLLYCHLILGLFWRLWEVDFCSQFDYPLVAHDFPSLVEEFGLSNRTGKLAPLNLLYSSVPFIETCDTACAMPVGLLIIIKSATHNFAKREAIRSTWGHAKALERVPGYEGLTTKLVFIVGQPVSTSEDFLVKYSSESHIHADMVEADFSDTYFNNTYKSVIALRWAAEICQDFKLLLLADDDMFVSIPNLVELASHPTTYEAKAGMNAKEKNIVSRSAEWRNVRFGLGMDTEKTHLYLGKVFSNAIPVRNIFGWNSKWYKSLHIYPYNRYPPYITGAAILFSKKTALSLYNASFFVRHFDLDDVYLGILAYKMRISPSHSDFFCLDDCFHYGHKGIVSLAQESFISAHGLQSPSELKSLWELEKSHLPPDLGSSIETIY